jgi:hypothetical protein
MNMVYFNRALKLCDLKSGTCTDFLKLVTCPLISYTGIIQGTWIICELSR